MIREQYGEGRQRKRVATERKEANETQNEVEVLKCAAVRRGSNKGQESEGKKEDGEYEVFYCFQLGLGVVIMAWRPAVCSSAPSPPSQALTHLPNGFSACCSLPAYGPARVNAGLSVLWWDIILTCFCFSV